MLFLAQVPVAKRMWLMWKETVFMTVQQSWALPQDHDMSLMMLLPLPVAPVGEINLGPTLLLLFSFSLPTSSLLPFNRRRGRGRGRLRKTSHMYLSETKPRGGSWTNTWYNNLHVYMWPGAYMNTTKWCVSNYSTLVDPILCRIWYPTNTPYKVAVCSHLCR